MGGVQDPQMPDLAPKWSLSNASRACHGMNFDARPRKLCGEFSRHPVALDGGCTNSDKVDDCLSAS